MYQYNNESHKIPDENHENHEKLIIYVRIMKIIELHKRINTIIKVLEFYLRKTKIMKI